MNNFSYDRFVREIEDLEIKMRLVETECPEIFRSVRPNSCIKTAFASDDKCLENAGKYGRLYFNYLRRKLVSYNILKVAKMQKDNIYPLGEKGKEFISEKMPEWALTPKKIKALIESAEESFSSEELKDRIVHFSIYVPGGENVPLLECDRVNALLNFFMAGYTLKPYSFTNIGYEYVLGVIEHIKMYNMDVEIIHSEILQSPSMCHMILSGSSNDVIFLRKESVLYALTRYTLADLKDIARGYTSSSFKFNLQLCAARCYENSGLTDERIIELYSEQVLDHQLSSQRLRTDFDFNQNVMLSLVSNALLSNSVSVLKDSIAYFTRTGPVARIIGLKREGRAACSLFMLITIIDTTYTLDYNNNSNLVAAILLNYIDRHGNVLPVLTNEVLDDWCGFLMELLAGFLAELYLISSNIVFKRGDRESSFDEIITESIKDKMKNVEAKTSSESRYSFSEYTRQVLVEVFPGYIGIINDAIGRFESKLRKSVFLKIGYTGSCSINEYVSMKINSLDTDSIRNEFSRRSFKSLLDEIYRR